MSICVTKNCLAVGEEVRGSLAGADLKNSSPVFCPKPRRLSPLISVDLVRPLPFRHQASCQVGFSDCKAGADTIDLLLSKGEDRNFVAPSTPFFCGSPPRRVSNPVVLDSRFGEVCPPPAPVLQSPVMPSPQPQHAPTPMSPRAGCVRSKFVFQTATVRVEGFDCLDRDSRRRSHGITAVA